ncbi:WhiB family transcriptional regulator [Gordonia sp. L191]|uniref:WhiB family transcriptional regulator n=1 Tax=Gordonia sp. L191 TaxID=2982699 RepID=UPI0024C093B6|nr:WhiB family transcriptional regulator [Gordonia sp. L191]WHU46771.1 WhiB family transcriptional regulator [Gordonia sp. L191]
MTAPDLRPLSLPLSMLLRPTLDLDWAAAACAAVGENPEDWFPFPTDDYSHAASVCAVCPIRAGCEQWGRRNRMSGVWGGVRLENGRERP